MQLLQSRGHFVATHCSRSLLQSLQWLRLRSDSAGDYMHHMRFAIDMLTVNWLSETVLQDCTKSYGRIVPHSLMSLPALCHYAPCQCENDATLTMSHYHGVSLVAAIWLMSVSSWITTPPHHWLHALPIMAQNTSGTQHTTTRRRKHSQKAARWVTPSYLTQWGRFKCSKFAYMHYQCCAFSTCWVFNFTFMSKLFVCKHFYII